MSVLTCFLPDGLQRGHDIADTDTTPDGHRVGLGVDGDVFERGDVDHDCVAGTGEGPGPGMAAVPSEDLAGV